MAGKTGRQRIRSNTIRFPGELYGRLQDLAHATGNSLNDTVVIAAGSYLRGYELEWGYLRRSPETLRDAVKEALEFDSDMVVKMVEKARPDRIKSGAENV